jgi:hypothetical protein
MVILARNKKNAKRPFPLIVQPVYIEENFDSNYLFLLLSCFRERVFIIKESLGFPENFRHLSRVLKKIKKNIFINELNYGLIFRAI